MTKQFTFDKISGSAGQLTLPAVYLYGETIMNAPEFSSLPVPVSPSTKTVVLGSLRVTVRRDK